MRASGRRRAAALGSLKAEHARFALENVHRIPKQAVVLAGNSFASLHDRLGYDIYSRVLTEKAR